MTRARGAATGFLRPERRPRLDPISSLADPGGYLWIRSGEGFAAWGQFARVDPGTGSERFRRAGEDLASAFRSIPFDAGAGEPPPLAIGSFTFDDADAGSAMVIPDTMVRTFPNHSSVTTFGSAAPPLDRPIEDLTRVDRIRYAGSTVSEVGWLDAVARTVREIHEGDTDKVVLARDLLVWSKTTFDVPLLLHRLARRFPGCYTFAFEGLVGATPELLVRRSGTRVASLVLAGSAPRGIGDDDQRLGEALLESDKDRSEHELAVTSVVSGLDPLCESISVEPEPRLLRLANVQHLATSIAGTLDRPYTALEVAGALHPTAAVCGTPADAALRTIREREGMARGRYAGPVGWVDARGDGVFGIALRCAEVRGNRARLFAGAGIVSGSVPEAELEETRLKLQAMQSAIDPTTGEVK